MKIPRKLNQFTDLFSIMASVPIAQAHSKINSAGYHRFKMS
jgi:hypothetical protein